MSPFIAELLGTMVMILLGDGVVANVVLKKTKGFQAGWITITTAWALAVFTGVVIAGPYSGAHLNPAITIGFAIAEKFPWASVGPYIIAQMLGAALGAFWYGLSITIILKPRKMPEPNWEYSAPLLKFAIIS